MPISFQQVRLHISLEIHKSTLRKMIRNDTIIILYVRANMHAVLSKYLCIVPLQYIRIKVSEIVHFI